MRGARELILAALGAAALTGCSDLERSLERAASARVAPSADVGRPARLLIPSIGVSTRLETLGLLPDGRLAPPRDFHNAGWWRGGPRPGQPGPAVIAGHVDSRTGPAVFAQLVRLRRGDSIVVVDSAGRRVRFAVRAVEEHPKDAFPTQRVYGHSRRAVLRLITCSGVFDRSTRKYRSNYVVFAETDAAA